MSASPLCCRYSRHPTIRTTRHAIRSSRWTAWSSLRRLPDSPGPRLRSLIRLARRAIALLRLRFDQPLDRCPTGALEPPDLEWPRSLRRAFSDPLVVHDDTGLSGRGTEEIKANDVTGRIAGGEAGMVIDLGRPGVGVRFSDIQKLTTALAALGTEFEPENPVTQFMQDRATGQLKPEILDEKVLSAIIEFKVEQKNLLNILKKIKALSEKIDTVFSLDLINRVNTDGTIPTDAIVKAAGFVPRPNTKTNVGLGRPLAEES